MTNIPNDPTQKWIRSTLVLQCLQAAMMIALLAVFLVILSQASADRRYVRVTDALLDTQARMERIEQNEAVLFRLLRNDGDQRGVIPDRIPVYPTPPQPKPAPYRPGSAMPGDAWGNIPGDSLGDVLGDTPPGEN